MDHYRHQSFSLIILQFFFEFMPLRIPHLFKVYVTKHIKVTLSKSPFRHCLLYERPVVIIQMLPLSSAALIAPIFLSKLSDFTFLLVSEDLLRFLFILVNMLELDFANWR